MEPHKEYDTQVKVICFYKTNLKKPSRRSLQAQMDAKKKTSSEAFSHKTRKEFPVSVLALKVKPVYHFLLKNSLNFINN